MQTNCLDIDLLAQSKSKSIPEKFCLQGSLTEAYLSSLFGTMSARSDPTTQTQPHLSTNSLEGGTNSPSVAGSRNYARTYQQQEKALELTENDQDSGQKWRGSFAKYDPNTHSLRTRQCSLFEDLTESCVTLPQWGLMRARECWERQTLAHLISATESGLSLPTPCKNEYAGASKKRFQGSPHFRGAKTSEALRTCEADPSYSHPQFIEKIMGFPIMWTGLAALEMRKSHSAQQQHGESCQEN